MAGNASITHQFHARLPLQKGPPGLCERLGLFISATRREPSLAFLHTAKTQPLTHGV